MVQFYNSNINIIEIRAIQSVLIKIDFAHKN